MKTLHLTLHKKWFDMVNSGFKAEEYRDQSDYWFKRLTDFFEGGGTSPEGYKFKEFDRVSFKNGYAKNAPHCMFECLGITEGFAKPEWCDNTTERLFIIKLGRRIPA